MSLKIIIVLLPCLFLSLQCGNSKENMKNMDVKVFLNSLSNSENYNEVIKKFYVNSDSVLSHPQLLEMNKAAFLKLNEVTNSPNIELLLYNDAIDKGYVLKEMLPLDDDEIVWVLYNNTNEQYYINVKPEGIVSVLPMVKGGKIIGWM